VTDTPTEEFRGGSIIWHDLLTTDIEASKRFYGGLFGWEFEEVPLSLGFGRSGDYLMIRNNGKLIGGMVDTSAVKTRINNSQWVPIMSVGSVDSAVQKILDSGGKVITPVTDLNERGRIAIITDATDALLALLEPRYGDPVKSQAMSGDFFWDEVWSDDTSLAVRFYRSLAPYSVREEDFNGKKYTALEYQGEPRFGFMQEPIPGLEPTWASYIKVDDMSVLEQVEELGGTVAIPAAPRGKGEVALILGPSGAGVVLQTWPEEG